VFHMTRTPDGPAPRRPDLTAKAAADLAARREREAAALRANLRRRKDQVRAREESDAPPSGQDETSR